MQVTETKTDELTREFRIAVPAADIELKVEKRLGELAQSLKLPGFRPGKVPVALLRKRYGESLRGEIVEEAINETTKAVINDHGLRPALPPRIELAPSDIGSGGGDLEYTLAVEVLPEITPPDFAAIELERLVAEVSDESTDEMLGRLAEAARGSSTVSEARPATVDDIVIIDVLAPEDKAPFGKGTDVAVSLATEGAAPGLESGLIGTTVGERKSLTIAFPEDHSVAALAGRSVTYEILVKELRSRDPLVLDDTLAMRYGAEGLSALREQVRQHQVQELKALSRMRLKRALLDRLDALYSFALPKGLVDREIGVIARQLAGSQPKAEPQDSPVADDADHSPGGHDADTHGLAADSAEEVEHVHGPGCGHDHHHEDDEEGAGVGEAPVTEGEREQYGRLAERRVRLGLVLAEIGRRNALQVTPEEVGKAMMAEARRFPGQEQRVLEFLRKSPQAKEALAAPILEEKVVDFIIELAKVKERQVTVEELLRDADEDTTSAADSGTAEAAANP